jgi:hypothetical protein
MHEKKRGLVDKSILTFRTNDNASTKPSPGSCRRIRLLNLGPDDAK